MAYELNHAEKINIPKDNSTNKQMLDELEAYYARVLDSSMLNLKSPETANIGFFNNLGKVYTDGPKIGRTLIYMTRPNLNFASRRNIDQCRVFSDLMTSKLGMTLARELMYSDLAGKINYGGNTEFNFINTGALVNSHVTKNDTGIGTGGVKAERQQHQNTNITSSDIWIAGADDEHIGDIKITDMTYKIGKSNFIPLITNTCSETSNAKDIILEVDETDGDYSGNRLVYGAGIDDTMGPGEITLTFEDLYGSPVMNLMILWIYYIHYVAKGICIPKYQYVINRIIDYTCSIYIFMLDTDQRTIIRWIKYTGCFPKSLPFGQILHTKEPSLQALSQIAIPFQYNFASPMDPIIKNEFNMLSEPALLNRKNINRTGKHTNFLTGSDFFRNKNHNLTLREGLDFMEDFPPNDDDIPDRLLNSGISRNVIISDDIIDATVWDGSTIDNKNSNAINEEVNKRDKNLFDIGLINRYKGMMDFRRNWGHPYICEGNQLLFL